MAGCAAEMKPMSLSVSETQLANKLVNDAIEAAVLQVTDDTSTSSSEDEYAPDSDILCGETMSAPVIEQADSDNKTADGSSADPVDSILDNAEVSPPVENFQEEDGWLFVLGHNMLKKREINEGCGLDSRPQRGDIVTIRSMGYLDGGYQVDLHEEQTFILGDGDVIPALDLSVALMELHEICEVYTEAKYAYGERGREPDIPGDASITYEVELLNVIGVPNFKSMSVNKTIKFSDQKRQRGNFLYSRGEHSAAIASYTKALQIIDANETSLNAISPEEMKQLQDIRVKCFNNLAAAQLKMEAYDVAIKSCESVLREEPLNTKALFRKGKCLAGKGNLKEAIQYLRKALKLEPESKLIHQELSHLVSELKEQEQMSRLIFQRMIGTPNTTAARQKMTKFPRWVTMIGGAAVVAVISVGLAAYHYGTEKLLWN